MTEKNPKRRFSQKTADFRRFTPSPGSSSMRRAPKTAENRRFSQKPADFAENRRKLQIGLRHLRSVAFSSALHYMTRTFFYNNFSGHVTSYHRMNLGQNKVREICTSPIMFLVMQHIHYIII